MHFLTKILVAVAALLAVALSALTILYTVNAGQIKDRYARAEELARVAESELIAQGSRLNAQINDLDNTILALNRDKTDTQGKVNELEREANQLRLDLRASETRRESVENKIAQLGETTSTQVELIRTYSQELSRLRDGELRFRKEKLELEDRVADLESQREVLEQTTKALQEQLSELRFALNQSEQNIEVGSAREAEGFISTGPIIRGRVMEVMPDSAAGGTLVRVNVGSNDQVSQNMLLSIARGNQFVGRLKVLETDLNWSVGRFEDLRLGQSVQSGDDVYSRFQ